MISRQEFIDAVSKIAIPATVVKTADKENGDFKSGGGRNLLDNHWIIQTADETKVRDAEKQVSFDIAVGFRNLRLTDESCLHDALTKRIICVEALNNIATPRRASAETITRLLGGFDWFLRWRIGKNILENAHLTLDDFKKFRADAEFDDIIDLVPVEHRLDLLLAEPDYRLPLYSTGRKFRMDWTTFANDLGVNKYALGRSRKFRDFFEIRLPDFLSPTNIKRMDVVLYVSKILPKPSQPVGDVETKAASWVALDRLSLRGLLPHDSIMFRVPQTSTDAGNQSRTKTLLPYDLMRVLKTAATWVLLYSDFIIHCAETRSALPPRERLKSSPPILALMEQLNSSRPEGFPPLNLGLASTFPAPEGTLRLSHAIMFLYVSCAILVGGFGGRRKNEVAYLQEGYLFRGRNPKLSIYIEKTLQDVDAIPVPEVVTKAYDLLLNMSASARAKTGKPWLFQFDLSFADGQYFDVNTRFWDVKGFLNVAGLAPPDGEEEWNFTFRMLRKGFVIAFYYGNLWGSFDGANRMLRHSSDGDMTRIYMDDEETGAISWLRSEVVRLTKLALTRLSPEQRKYLEDARVALRENDDRRRLWNEGRQEFFVQKMMEVFDGFEHPIGRGAARMLDSLKEMEDRAYARIHFAAMPTNDTSGARENVLGQVKHAASEFFMEPVPGGFFYCLFKRGSQEHSELANCLKAKKIAERKKQEAVKANADTRPDYLFSGLHPCLDCDLCACFDESQKALDQTALSMQADVAKAASPGLAASAQQYVDDIFSLIAEAKRAVDGKQRPR